VNQAAETKNQEHVCMSNRDVWGTSFLPELLKLWLYTNLYSILLLLGVLQNND